MTPVRPDLLEAADAELLTAVRAGDSEAFGIVYERHAAAARRLAYQLAGAAGPADEVVAEAFGRMLDVVARGGGPSSAVRQYVLTAVRQVCYDRLRGTRGEDGAEAATLPDPDQLLVDPAFAGLETALIARAYQSLPERSRAVLWHTEIEHDSPADVAPLLGLTRNGVSALRRRAADDLRQAYLQMHISLITQPGCRPVAERLGAFDRRNLSARDAALVSEHLARCEGCQVVHRELTDIMATVRGVVAPLVLGPAATVYLADAEQRTAAVTAGAGGLTDLGIGARLSIAGSSGRSLSPPSAAAAVQAGPDTAPLVDPDQFPPSPRAHRRALGQPARRTRRPRRLAIAALAGVLLAGTAGIALAMSLGGHGKAPTTALQLHAASPLHAAATLPPQSASASPSPSARPSARPSLSPSPSASRSPASPPSPVAAPIQLAASLTVSGRDSFGRVVFEVSNTGSVASGSLTAVIALPAGASLSSGGGRHGGQSNSQPGGGWTCQADSSGATCTRAALPAGQQAQGTLSINLGGSGTCGQPVQLTVTGGAAPVAASQPIAC